jgi:hypothetical protein
MITIKNFFNRIINSNFNKLNIINLNKNKINFYSTKSYIIPDTSIFNIKINNESKFSNIINNPKLKKLYKLLENGNHKTDIMELKNYINNIIELSPNDLYNIYANTNNIITPIWSYSLPEGFDKLIEYKGIAGIYYYNSKEGKGYVGSTSDLRRRNFSEHKNNINKKGKHIKFYDYIKKNTWSAFTLYIMAVIPDHVKNFSIIYNTININSTEQELLEILNLYHLTLVEQFFIDNLPHDLNGSKFSSASSYNIGSLGVIRDQMFKNNLSLKYLGRQYAQSTIEIHKILNKGKTLSKITRNKMSKSHGGVKVYVLNLLKSQIEVFPTKLMASKFLNISMRTLSRWADDPLTIHEVKSIEYNKVQISLKPFNSLDYPIINH